MRDADDPCLVRLLGALATALEARVDAGRRSELAALARTVLEDVRGRWDAGHRPLALAPLEAWFEAAGWLAPPPRSPDVAPTWFELLPASDLSGFDDIARAADWVALVELLGRYDPTTRMRLGGAERMRAVVEEARTRISASSGPERAALAAILQRAARIAGYELASAGAELEQGEPPPLEEAHDRILAAYSERRLVERVLRDL